MTISVADIRGLCKSLYPDIKNILDHDSDVTRSTWGGRLDTGKALELLTVCAIADAARSIGVEVHSPVIFNKHPDLFYVRNVIPRHHGAQPGHEGVPRNVPLLDKFLSALTPKIVLHHDSKTFGIYREGFPVHAIHAFCKGKPEYLDRPDILIVEGALKVSPEIGSTIGFTYDTSCGSCKGVLRVKNDIKIPIVRYSFADNLIIPIRGIIECSIGKSTDMAKSQLMNYKTLFAGHFPLVSMLVNGNMKSCKLYDFVVNTDLTHSSIDELTNLLTGTLTLMLKRALALS